MKDELEEVSERDNEDGPPCVKCGHKCLEHDDEFGDCGVRTDDGICDCCEYEAAE